ncbi:MAG: riboflavin synthase [Rickettsiales bacterium]
MFTGIVEFLGEVKEIKIKEFDRDFIIFHQEDIKLKIGDSIAVNGVCLTVRELCDNKFTVSAGYETLKLTNLSKIELNDQVNLECSLSLEKPLGGHLVQGHIANTSNIISKTNAGESIYFKFSKPLELKNYIVKKGYIAIDGMSLTICDEGKDWFEIMLIPHTLSVTIAKNYKVGSLVNIEVDIFARYMEKLYEK